MITKQRLDNAFMVGLAAIALDIAAYMFDFKHAGVAFCAGLFICLVSCLVSILQGERARKEDIAILAAGILALGWLALRNI